ncbi:hypothetical protein DFJ77DRAFT_290830 [Powellomyces hirtus]|nr:hypothetical protein DFJ77DRAFT_290830 [Powellomyces hirtus]
MSRFLFSAFTQVRLFLTLFSSEKVSCCFRADMRAALGAERLRLRETYVFRTADTEDELTRAISESRREQEISQRRILNQITSSNTKRTEPDRTNRRQQSVEIDLTNSLDSQDYLAEFSTDPSRISSPLDVFSSSGKYADSKSRSGDLRTSSEDNAFDSKKHPGMLKEGRMNEDRIRSRSHHGKINPRNGRTTDMYEDMGLMTRPKPTTPVGSQIFDVTMHEVENVSYSMGPETPTRFKQHEVDHACESAGAIHDRSRWMSDAERQRRHVAFVKALMQKYHALPASKPAKRTPSTNTSRSQTRPRMKRTPKTHAIGHDVRFPELEDEEHDYSVPVSGGISRSMSPLTEELNAMVDSPASTSHKADESSSLRKMTLSSVLKQSATPVSIVKDQSCSRNPQYHSLGENKDTSQVMEDCGDDRDAKRRTSPEVPMLPEISEVPETVRKRKKTGEHANGPLPKISPASVERATMRSNFSDVESEDELVSACADTRMGTPKPIRRPFVDSGSDDEDETDRLLMSTPGFGSGRKAGHAARGLSNVVGLRSATTTPSTKCKPRSTPTSGRLPSPAFQSDQTPISAQERQPASRASTPSHKRKRPESDGLSFTPVMESAKHEIPCPMCNRNFGPDTIEVHAATCEGLDDDEVCEEPASRSSTEVLTTKTKKLEELAKKRRKKSRGIVDDIEEDTSDERPQFPDPDRMPGPSILSYLTKSSEKTPPRVTQKARSEGAAYEECSHCGAWITRCQTMQHQQECQSSRDAGANQDDIGRRDNMGLEAAQSKLPKLQSTTSSGVSDCPFALEREEPRHRDDPGDYEHDDVFAQATQMDYEDMESTENYYDEQLSPLEGFEDMENDDGDVDWFNVPATSTKKPRATPKSTRGRGGGGNSNSWRGKGRGRSNWRGKAGKRNSAAGRSMQSRG